MTATPSAARSNTSQAIRTTSAERDNPTAARTWLHRAAIRPRANNAGVAPSTTCTGLKTSIPRTASALRPDLHARAAPHVTGVVSLMLAKNPNLTPAQIATGLCASADDIGDTKEGCGRLDAAAAVTWEIGRAHV